MTLPPEVLRELQEEYLASFPELLNIVKEAVGKSDWKSVESYFHKFAGSGSTYGLPLITEIARDLETYIIKTAVPNTHTILETITKFEKVLENYRNQMGIRKSG
jgi:HPt (histidine-containing phosphotransfer) domain-containing protein